MSRCRDCDHEVIWAVNPAGRPIKFDPKPDPSAGYWRLTVADGGMKARMVPYGPELQRAYRDGVDLFMPHHCPARNPRY